MVDASWILSNPAVVRLDCAGDVTISGWDNSTVLTSITSQGQITIDGTLTIGSMSKPVVLYSESDSRAMEMKGSNRLTIYGYLYAPQGEVYVGGSARLSWVGSVIADEVDINGTGSGGGTVAFLALDPTLRLVQ